MSERETLQAILNATVRPGLVDLDAMLTRLLEIQALAQAALMKEHVP